MSTSRIVVYQAFGHKLMELLGPSRRSLLPSVPRFIKVIIAFVFLLNWKSWPFMWHYRVLKPLIDVRLHLLLAPNKRKWIDDRRCRMPETDPFNLVHVAKRYASFDDCDFNMHLSNSAYSKNVDTTRSEVACDVFGPLLAEGVWIPLAGTQYSFVREIPMGTHYEIHTSFGGWGEKWLYVVSKFVSHPKAKKAKATQNPSNSIIEGPSTPSLIYTPPAAHTPDLKSVDKAILDAPITMPTSQDDSVVHCVAVSRYCFKIGRITIPPAVLFVAGGLGDPAKKRWSRIQDLRFSKAGNRIPEMLKGGWRTDVVEGWPQSSNGPWSSFWDLNEFERRRKEGMDGIFTPLQSSWDTFKDIHAI